MDQLGRRQEFTPDGQELPPWLAYEVVTTTIDGTVLTTGTIVQLPQTYYGPSIPLGDGWEYGGSVSPTETALQTSESVIPTTSPDDEQTSTSLSAPASSTSDAVAPAIPSASSVVSASTSSVSTTATSASTATSSALSPTSPSGSSSASPSPSYPAPSPPSPGNGFTIDTDRLPNLTVLIPSLIGSLLVAILLLLLAVCYRRRRDYRRAGTTEPDDQGAAKGARGLGKVLGGRATPGGYAQVSTVDMTDVASAGDAQSGAGPNTAGGAIVGEALPSATGNKEKHYGPLISHSGMPAALSTRRYPSGSTEVHSTDITDHPSSPSPNFPITGPAHGQGQGILSRLSTGLGLGFGLGLGAAPKPIARQMSNGTAEKAMRMPSWAQVADIGTAVRRHVSSSTFGRVISRASGYGAVPTGGGNAGVGDVWAGDIGVDGKHGMGEKHNQGYGAVLGPAGAIGASAAAIGQKTPRDAKGSTHDPHLKNVEGTPATSYATPGSNSTTIPPSQSLSNTRSMGDSELFYAPPPSASTWIHGFFRSRSSRGTSDSNSHGNGSGRDQSSQGSHSDSHNSIRRSLAPTHASTSGSNFSSANSHPRSEWSDESRGTVITRDSRSGRSSRAGAGAGEWRARARAFAGDDFGVRVRDGSFTGDVAEQEHDARSNAALPLGAHDVLPAYTLASPGIQHDMVGGSSEDNPSAIAGNNDDTVRARRHTTRPNHGHPDQTPIGSENRDVRTVSVGIPYTPASRVASVPSSHSTDSDGALADSPTRANAQTGFQHAHGKQQSQPQRTDTVDELGPSNRQGRGQGRGRSRFPSHGGDRLDFPLPPATLWTGAGTGGEADSLLAESEYHSAHSNISSRQPSPTRLAPASTDDTRTARDTTDAAPPGSALAQGTNTTPLGTFRRAFGLSHLFRSPPPSPTPHPHSKAAAPVPIRPGPVSSGISGASARTRSYESRYSYALTSEPHSAGLDGSIEGPLSARAMQAARPVSAGAPRLPGTSAGQAAYGVTVEGVGRDTGAQVLLGARESGVAVPRLQMVSRSTIGREQQWDEFGQLRVREPSNILPPVTRHSHIGSIHISDSTPSVYSRGTSSSGGNSSLSNSAPGSAAPSARAGQAGPGQGRASRKDAGASGESIADGGSVGSGVSKGSKVSKISQVSQGVPDRALRGRRSAATLVRSSSPKSTATSHNTPHLSSSASTPMVMHQGQLPAVLQPVTPVQSAPARGRMERVPRIAALSSASPSSVGSKE